MTTESIDKKRRARVMTEAQQARAEPDERPSQRPTRAVRPPAQTQGVTSLAPELASGRQPVTRREAIAWAVIGTVAFIMRLWDVGHRAMHHDESLHAVYSWGIVKWLKGDPSAGYHYDPMMHGPYQFHQNALFMFIFGGNETAGRLGSVVCGTALVLTPFLLRRYLGRNGAFILALLLCFSPFELFFSRFMREDMPFALWTVLSICAFFRYIEHGKHHYRWLWLLGASVALLWSTLESSVEVFAMLGGYIVLILIMELTARRGRHQVLLSAMRDTPKRTWVISIGIMVAIVVFLYWPIGNEAGAGENPLWAFIPGLAKAQGYSGNPMDALTGGLTYWKGQQTVARGSQPWYYYFMLVPLYEQVGVVFGLWGLWYALKRRTIFTAFVVWWALCTWVFYVWASEKMPWLGLHLTIPLLFAASLVITRFIVHAPRRGWRWYVPAALLLLTGVTTVRGAQAMAYVNGDDPTEMMVYVQSSQDVVKTVNYTNELAKALGEVDKNGKPTMPVAVDCNDAYCWPYSWYFRDYPIANGWGSTPDSFRAAVNTAQVMIVSSANYPGVAQYLHGNFVGTKMVFNWWFPEDYKNYELTSCGTSACGPSLLLHDLTSTPVLANLWNWWLVRQPFDQQQFAQLSNARIMYFLVNKKDAALMESFGAKFQPLPVVTPAPTAIVPATKVRSVAASLIIGKGGVGAPSFPQVEGVAVANNHNLYVVDNQTNKITEFDPSGKLLTSWGSTGAGPGQFNRPDGVAVDATGNVYVADTWNGRIQKFTASGQFITAWGSPKGALSTKPGEFYGPRGLTVMPNGDVAVADTGNKRIEVFSANGAFLYTFGTSGSGNGQFDEPSSVVADSAGNLYVADYWNGRIQKLDSKGNYLAQWAVPGWGKDGSYTEPYLTISAAGDLIVPDPADGQVLVYTTTGTLVEALGTAGSASGQFNTPLGLAADGTSLWVGDQGNDRVQKVSIP